MKIAISGAHSQGKTTLVEALKNQEFFKDYKFLTNLTRNLHNSGVSINEQGTEVTQLLVMTEHFKRLQEGNNLILDRCALDGCAYTLAVLNYNNDPNYFKINNNHAYFEGMFNLAEYMLLKYDYIFYIKPELPLVDDGIRTVNQNFFNNVVSRFETCINAALPEIKKKIIVVSGSVEERVNQIVQKCKETK